MAIAPQSNSDWGSALFIGHATAADMTKSAPPPISFASIPQSRLSSPSTRSLPMNFLNEFVEVMATQKINQV